METQLHSPRENLKSGTEGVLQRQLDYVVRKALDCGQIVGVSVLVAQDGEVLFERHAGLADRERQLPVARDTQFRLASMTKPLVSAAALAQVERGTLSLDAPVTDWLPWFTPKLSDGRQPVITLRHLLSHTAGLTYGFLTPDNEPYRSAGVSDGIDESVLSLEDNLRRIAAVPLIYEPGSSWCYSVATDVLGGVLEAACGTDLGAIVKSWITDPLGMTDTGFRVENPRRLAQAYANAIQPGLPPRKMLEADAVQLEGCGPIQYAPGRIHNPEAYPSGGTGMAGTALDYLRFLETIRQGGRNILSSRSTALMTADVVDFLPELAAGPGLGFGLGFSIIRSPAAAGTPRRHGSYGWGGVYGTSAFVDPEARLSVVILTNTALEGLTGVFPQHVTEAIYTALT